MASTKVFKMGELIAKGGFAECYRAEYLGSQVAVKILDLSDETLAEEAMKEMMTLMKIDKHENIISLVQCFARKKKLSIVMELGDLGDLVQYHAIFIPNLPNQVELMLQIAKGVEFLHSQNVVHRDLKPNNVVCCSGIGDVPVMKITDFGLARTMDKQDSTFYMKTFCGTRPFMAPEFWRQESYTSSVDIYASGMTLCAMMWFDNEDKGSLKKLQPFPKGSRITLGVTQNFNKDVCIVTVKDGDSHLVKAVKEVILYCTNFDHKKRPKATALVQMLENIMKDPSEYSQHSRVLRQDTVTGRQTDSDYETLKSLLTQSSLDSESTLVSREPHESSGGQTNSDYGSSSTLKASDRERMDDYLKVLMSSTASSLLQSTSRISESGYYGDTESLFSVGDSVSLKSSGSGQKSGWNDDMKNFCDKTGTVVNNLGGKVTVQPPDGPSFIIDSSFLKKVTLDSGHASMKSEQFKFKPFDIVRITPSKAELTEAQCNSTRSLKRLTWCLGTVALVKSNGENGFVVLECINGDTVEFHEDILEKVDSSGEPISCGDAVVVTNDREVLKKYHKNPTEDMTELMGQICVVKSVQSNGVLTIESGSNECNLNQNCTTLFVKADELVKSLTSLISSKRQ